MNPPMSSVASSAESSTLPSAASPTGAPSQTDDELEPGHFVVFHGATWSDYQRLLGLRGDKSWPRIVYLEGTLQLTSLARRHARVTSLVGRLVEAYCFEKGIDLTPSGNWTLENRRPSGGPRPTSVTCSATMRTPRPRAWRSRWS
jgi:hypothetical protein